MWTRSTGCVWHTINKSVSPLLILLCQSVYVSPCRLHWLLTCLLSCCLKPRPDWRTSHIFPSCVTTIVYHPPHKTVGKNRKISNLAGRAGLWPHECSNILQWQKFWYSQVCLKRANLLWDFLGFMRFFWDFWDVLRFPLIIWKLWKLRFFMRIFFGIYGIIYEIFWGLWDFFEILGFFWDFFLRFLMRFVGFFCLWDLLDFLGFGIFLGDFCTRFFWVIYPSCHDNEEIARSTERAVRELSFISVTLVVGLNCHQNYHQLTSTSYLNVLVYMIIQPPMQSFDHFKVVFS